MFAIKCVETELFCFPIIKYSLIILKVNLRYFCPDRMDAF